MTETKPRQHSAGIIGRTLRLMLGLLFGWMTYTVMRNESPDLNVRILAVFGIMTAFYVLLHLVISRVGTRLHSWYGTLPVMVPVVLVFAFGGPGGQLGTAIFVTASLLLQTVTGDSGCLAMAIPAFVLRRPTHLHGILFAPIDFIEKFLTGPGGLPG